MASRILGLDIGDARIGVAMSDPLGMFASPLCTIEKRNENPVRRVVELIREHGVTVVVFGLPYELNGTIGPQAEKVLSTVEKLEQAVEQSADETVKSVRIVAWDERMSTKQAKSVMQGSKLKDRENSAALDRVSAAIILDSFMQAKRSGAVLR